MKLALPRLQAMAGKRCSVCIFQSIVVRLSAGPGNTSNCNKNRSFDKTMTPAVPGCCSSSDNNKRNCYCPGNRQSNMTLLTSPAMDNLADMNRQPLLEPES